MTTLPRGKIETTPLGFGCGTLVGGFEDRQSRRLVHAAFDAGLRHFDVAPSYGMGMAEDVLGKALAGRRDQVTITSKAGIARPQIAPHIRLMRMVARPVRRMVPALTRKVGQRLTGAAAARGCFSAQAVAASLEDSLRRLRTDYLDAFLLHEPRLEDVTDELLTLLDSKRRQGMVCAIGVASAYESAVPIARHHGDFFDIFQFRWNVLEDNATPVAARYAITHGAVTGALGNLRNRLDHDDVLRGQLVSRVGMEVNGNNLTGMLIGAALARNAHGLVLATSARVARIALFRRVMENDNWRAAGRMLEQFVAENGMGI